MVNQSILLGPAREENTMRKKIAVLSAIFLVFLVVGWGFNLQQGLYFGDSFWKLEGENRYASYGNWISFSPEDGFLLHFADQEMTAQFTELDENRCRMEFSDGIAVELADDDNSIISVEIGGIVWFSGAEYVVTDIESGHFQFAAAQEPIHNPIFDETGNVIGENILLRTADGQDIDFREVYYDYPEWSGPERERIVIQNGTRFTDEDLQNKLFQNEQGEYLLNSETFTLIKTSVGSYVNRGSLARFMLDAARGKSEARGEPAAIVLYAVFYLLGAVSFLFPEKTAFLGQRWRYKNEPELSDSGRFAVLAGSVIVMGMGVVLMFMGL